MELVVVALVVEEKEEDVPTSAKTKFASLNLISLLYH